VLEKKLEFQQALAGMGRQGQLIYLAGYLPHDAVAEVTRAAQAQRWGISIQDPSEEDAVPTFLRIPRWAQKIKPVMALLGIVPGYRELDVSAVFLVFFSIFFGILIGDAGYGAAYVLLTFWAQKKIKAGPATAHIFPLLYLLSSCAILWGILTGSFFGQAWLVKYGIRPLVPRLNDPNNMQTFCFFLGAFHLSIAHAWRTILKLPALSALADVGWICVLWAAFFLARMLLLGATLPGYVQWLIVAGIGLVIFFTHPQRNLLKTVLEGLGTIALSLMNNFTDVVSYVRLFAVGMAGVAIAETTNSMAAGLNGVLFGAASVLIVLIGHGLNIVLGPMSVLVHGVRLNVLEFSGHAGVSWSGTEYQPLKS
jgi:V/A-type H+-transporting ATPase subunit I